MSSRPFPTAKNYQDLAWARHRIELILKEMTLELQQMEWIIQGERDPRDIHRHRKALKRLTNDLKAAVKREAAVQIESWEA